MSVIDCPGFQAAPESTEGTWSLQRPVCPTDSDFNPSTQKTLAFSIGDRFEWSIYLTIFQILTFSGTLTSFSSELHGGACHCQLLSSWSQKMIPDPSLALMSQIQTMSKSCWSYSLSISQRFPFLPFITADYNLGHCQLQQSPFLKLSHSVDQARWELTVTSSCLRSTGIKGADHET